MKLTIITVHINVFNNTKINCNPIKESPGKLVLPGLSFILRCLPDQGHIAFKGFHYIIGIP
jgi:hypothetical protein